MKTTVDVDRETAREAAEILGTATLKDTVNAALHDVVRRRRLRQFAREIRDGALPLPTPEDVRRLNEPALPAGALAWLIDDE
jgi:hypothetical protein